MSLDDFRRNLEVVGVLSVRGNAVHQLILVGEFLVAELLLQVVHSNFVMDVQTKKDAAAFIEFYNSEDFTLRALVPDYGHAPRYLLSERKAVLQNSRLLKAAPLYKRFYEVMQTGVTLSALGLNEKTRKVGDKIDKAGFNPRP